MSTIRMQTSPDGNGNIEIREAYTGLSLVTIDDERLHVCMRDTGFEMTYEVGDKKIFIELKRGEIIIHDEIQDATRQRPEHSEPV